MHLRLLALAGSTGHMIIAWRPLSCGCCRGGCLIWLSAVKWRWRAPGGLRLLAEQERVELHEGLQRLGIVSYEAGCSLCANKHCQSDTMTVLAGNKLSIEAHHHKLLCIHAAHSDVAPGRDSGDMGARSMYMLDRTGQVPSYRWDSSARCVLMSSWGMRASNCSCSW